MLKNRGLYNFELERIIFTKLGKKVEGLNPKAS